MAHQFADGIFTLLLALQRTCSRCCKTYVFCLQVSSMFLMMFACDLGVSYDAVDRHAVFDVIQVSVWLLLIIFVQIGVNMGIILRRFV